jgi:predicted phosphohydrolase
MDYVCGDIIGLLERYSADTCCFGHLHGYSHRKAVTGIINGIDYKLVSADYVDFSPAKII